MVGLGSTFQTHRQAFVHGVTFPFVLVAEFSGYQNIHNRIVYIRSLSCGNEGYWWKIMTSLRVGPDGGTIMSQLYFHPSVFGPSASVIKLDTSIQHGSILPHISGQVRLLPVAGRIPIQKNRLPQPDPAHSLRVSSGEVPSVPPPSPVPDTR